VTLKLLDPAQNLHQPGRIASVSIQHLVDPVVGKEITGHAKVPRKRGSVGRGHPALRRTATVAFGHRVPPIILLAPLPILT
jgi:hypothetical protein